MSKIKNFLRRIEFNKKNRNFRVPMDSYHRAARVLNMEEVKKVHSRSSVINFILGNKPGKTSYLEIGVRNPADNFEKIQADIKYSVDPGLEYDENPVDFKLSSNEFFDKIDTKKIALDVIEFDVIFIDGLHLAAQVDLDIENAIRYLKIDGFIVLHDCNPPTEWHARETFDYTLSPAEDAWNGTVWKAFLKRRMDSQVSACCIDTDWGVGVISKSITLGSKLEERNMFFEYKDFAENRKEYLNLISFTEFQDLIS